jgi:hypothetical protein
MAIAHIEKRYVRVDKVSLGIVFGYATVSKENGVDYYDTQGDHISDEDTIPMAYDFAKGQRLGDDMHDMSNAGFFPFIFPLTEDVAKALAISASKYGTLVGFKPATKELLAKFESGEYTGFSIGGVGERETVSEAA